MKARTTRLLLAALTAMLVVSSGAAPVVAQSADAPRVAQQSNETSSPTQTDTLTPTAGQCNPSDPPQMETARLFTREDTIQTDQPGVIAGGFLPPAGLQCDIVVRVTMQVPNNMYIQGTDGLGSGGAGIVSSEFTIPAGASSVQSVRANVYTSETGELPVTADITYYPEGHPDLQRSISGLTLKFNIQEPNESPTTPTPYPTGTVVHPPPPSGGLLDLAILGLIIVGTVAAIVIQRTHINVNS